MVNIDIESRLTKGASDVFFRVVVKRFFQGCMYRRF